MPLVVRVEVHLGSARRSDRHDAICRFGQYQETNLTRLFVSSSAVHGDQLVDLVASITRTLGAADLQQDAPCR